MANMRIDKPATVTKVVLEVFDGLKPGAEFSGLEFKRLCVKLNPAFKNKFEDTFMRLLRMKRRNEFICIKRSDSKYKKIGGAGCR